MDIILEGPEDDSIGVETRCSKTLIQQSRIVVFDRYCVIYIDAYKINFSVNPYNNIRSLSPTSIVINRITKPFNTLRTGDADLRFYITTVQDG